MLPSPPQYGTARSRWDRSAHCLFSGTLRDVALSLKRIAPALNSAHPGAECHQSTILFTSRPGNRRALRNARARARGVDVRLIADRAAPCGGTSGIAALSDAGVPIWIDDQARIAHAKTIVIIARAIDAYCSWGAGRVRARFDPRAHRRRPGAGRGARAEDGPTVQAHRPPEARGDQASQPRRDACRH